MYAGSGLPDVLATPAADEALSLPGFTADPVPGEPHIESYPIQEHDPSDYVESFPIGEEAGPQVFASASTPAELLEQIASGEKIQQDDTRNFQHAYGRHAHQWGFDAGYNRANAVLFAQTLIDHKADPDTQVSEGTFRKWIEVTHYYNPQTGMWLGEYNDGTTNFAAFKLNRVQAKDLNETGNVP